MWLYLILVVGFVLGVASLIFGLWFLAIPLFLIAAVALFGTLTGAFAGQRDASGRRQQTRTTEGGAHEETGYAHPGQEHPSGPE